MANSCLDKQDLLLGEGSMYERLRRSGAEAFDPMIAHAGFLYDDLGQQVLAETHREYLDIGQKYGLPMVAGTPTWRTSAARIAASGHASESVNADAARFMRDLCDGYGADAVPILICGVTGPKGDGYLPDEAPTSDEARLFHRPQIEALAGAGVDYLSAFTLPNAEEAFGIAQEMAATGLPYQLSFVLRPDGTLLDGTALADVIERIDNDTDRPPHSYASNCVHASVFASALRVTAARNPQAVARMVELNANTSAKSPEELDGLEELDTEAPEDFGANMAGLRSAFGIKSLGGCCGTGTEHIEALARELIALRTDQAGV